MPDGVLASLQAIAVIGASRKVLEIPGVQHGDPMAMAVRIGNLVFSSRVLGGGRDRERARHPDEHTARILANIRYLLQQSGGDWQHLSQATVFLGGPEYRGAVERQWRMALGDHVDKARLHFIETDLGRGRDDWPRIEFVAVL